jgi:hypothetical protein
MPAGWMLAGVAPTRCAGTPQPSSVVAAIPNEDFAFALRVGVWPANALTPSSAAAACSPRRGSFGAASYAARTEWLGVTYVTEGVFTADANQTVQIEVSATEDKAAAARALLAAWLKRTAP